MAKKSATNASLLKYSRGPSSQQSSQASTSQTSNKEVTQTKYITTSTSLSHVFAMILLGMCRRVTNGEHIRKRIFFYLCLVIVGGLVHDYAPVINHSFMFKVHKTNALNQWFVKIGWFWTSLLTFPLMALTSHILSVDKNKNNTINVVNGSVKNTTKLKQLLSVLRTRQLLRWFLNSVVWFISVQFFVYFENLTSDCSVNDFGTVNKKTCLENGHKWSAGFDISGHTFLLIYCNLIILEECAVMIGWEPFGNVLQEESLKLERQNQTHSQWQLYLKYLLSIRVTFVAITLLSIIWDFMLIQTSLFYHTMIQKLIAAIWAFALWFVTYQYFYKFIAIDVKSPKSLKNT